MKKVAVLISGCGYLDGAEIRESVITLLELERHGIDYEIVAPDRDQYHVVNHITQEEVSEKRSILVEAARIARGKVTPLEKFNSSTVDGLVIPGGFGVAKNFCSFAFEGAQGSVQVDVATLINDIHQNGKPIGGICVSPALIALTLRKELNITLGPDEGTKTEVEKLGVSSHLCNAENIVVDEANKIVTTSAYMNDQESLKDVALGIEKCIKQLSEWL